MITKDVEIVVVIGGNIMREVDYGFTNKIVVYISPNIETHDLISGAKLATVIEKDNRIFHINKVF